jgi:uracil-DNA glycosylase
MKPSTAISCPDLPCADMNHGAYMAPKVAVDPAKIRMVMVSECAPSEPGDWYYARGKSLFAETTLQAFADAGVDVESMKDLLDLGVYLTAAVKCGKTGYTIPKACINQCSLLLEKELAPFHGLKVIMLMGDTAIHALNCIARRNGQPRVIPAGSTYKIRGGRFDYAGARVFPSYLQAGPSFFIEKTKRKMIAEDIAAAMKNVTNP